MLFKNTKIINKQFIKKYYYDGTSLDGLVEFGILNVKFGGSAWVIWDPLGGIGLIIGMQVGYFNHFIVKYFQNTLLFPIHDLLAHN